MSNHLQLVCNEVQAQLDDTAVRLAAQEAALRGSQQRQQLVALRAQLNALQHAPMTAPSSASALQTGPVSSPGTGTIFFRATRFCNSLSCFVTHSGQQREVLPSEVRQHNVQHRSVDDYRGTVICLILQLH